MNKTKKKTALQAQVLQVQMFPNPLVMNHRFQAVQNKIKTKKL